MSRYSKKGLRICEILREKKNRRRVFGGGSFLHYVSGIEKGWRDMVKWDWHRRLYGRENTG